MADDSMSKVNRRNFLLGNAAAALRNSVASVGKSCLGPSIRGQAFIFESLMVCTNN
jgi:hypothetical protein